MLSIKLVAVILTLVWVCLRNVSSMDSSSSSSQEDAEAMHNWKPNVVKDTRFTENVLINNPDILHQALERFEPSIYGKQVLERRSDELNNLRWKPPKGTHQQYCEGMRNNSRALYSYAGLIMPDISFVFYEALGRLLQKSNGLYNKKIHYHDYYDNVSDLTYCYGVNGDDMVRRITKLYSQNLYDVGEIENDLGVEREMKSVKKNLEHLVNDNKIMFKPDCNVEIFKRYFNRKMDSLMDFVDNMNEDSSDMEVYDAFIEHLGVSPIISTYYLCVGYHNRRKMEMDDVSSIIYKLRERFNLLMSKEARREENLMGTLKTAPLATEAFYRHYSVELEANGTLFCWNTSQVLKESKVLNVFYCGLQCEAMFRASRRNLKNKTEEPCGQVEDLEMPCSSCYLTYPISQKPSQPIHQNAVFYKKMKTVHLYVFPDRNLPMPSLQLPALSPDYMHNLTKENIIPRRPIGITTHFPIFPYRQHYVHRKEHPSVDWSYLINLGIAIFVGITVCIWSLYFLLGNLPYMLRWYRRRRDRQM